MVGLDGATFLNDTLVSVGKRFSKETLPFAVGKGIVVQKLQLPSEVGNQTVSSWMVRYSYPCAVSRRLNFFSRAASL